MADKFDSTSWTGDTSHRAPEFTPETKAEIGRSLTWVAAAVAVFLLVAVIFKGLM